VAFVNNGYGIYLISVSIPWNLIQTGFLNPEDIGFGMNNNPVISNEHLLLWNNYVNHLYVYDLTDGMMSHPEEIYAWNYSVQDALWQGDYLLTANGSLGVNLLHFPQTGISDAAAPKDPQSLVIAPNPFRKGFNISLKQNKPGWVSYSVCNLKGQMVFRSNKSYKSAGQIEIQALAEPALSSQLAAGIYLIRVKTAEGMLTGKAVKLP